MVDREAGASQTAPEQRSPPAPYWAGAARFTLAVAALVVFLGLLMFVLHLVFVWWNWSGLSAAGAAELRRALVQGLRFDAAVVAVLAAPAVLLAYALAVTRRRPLRWLCAAYVGIVSLLVPALYLADVQYFEETGSHFSSEVLAHLGPASWPVVSAAFQLHPWLCWLSLAGCLGLAALSARLFGRLLDWSLPADGRRRPWHLLALPLWAALAVVAMRGGIGKFPLAVGDSLVSPNPYVNGLCLNPLYSILRSATSGEGRQYRFFDEGHNVEVVRRLLDCGVAPHQSARYPLVRESPGAPRGNRKNVILFFLESWSGKDLGCLGGDPRTTPVFDRLAGQGLLFTNFYATGLRTPEGVFSTFCSFPNQPLRPVTNRQALFQDHWRGLSQILAEVGYRNIFVHGRDLDFDNVRELLAAMSFQTIIDRRDFPPSVSTISDSWPGYSDEEVMRRADQEFAALGGRPFFGVIYTMNTHPAFITPEGYPLLYEPRTVAERFLNALNYSDHTLGMFFELARRRPYSKDTIFIFVADHSRTSDDFNYGDQHHIPFLIYAPGQVAPGRRSAVAGQLDLLPTVLGLLGLKARHAAWGRDLLAAPDDDGFAVSVAGDQVRWRTREWLLVDSPKVARPLLFHVAEDPQCRNDVWLSQPAAGGSLRAALRAYMSLSQTLLYQDRIFPVNSEKLSG